MSRSDLRPRRVRAFDARDHGDEGFTLVEMILSTLLLPIVMGAIVISLGTLFLFSTSASNVTNDAADAQLVSANYVQDVQNAASLTTSSAAPECGTGTQLLGLEWGLNPSTSSYQYVVSYVEVQSASGYQLVRQYCSSGISSSPTTISVVSSDLPKNQPSPVVTPSGQATGAAAGWILTNSITGVNFTITEPKSKFNYALTAVPSASGSSSGPSTFLTPTTGCGFASAGTGTYASTLCFVDFASYDPSATPKGCGGDPQAQTVSASVTNTPYILSFCITQAAASGQPSAPMPFFT